MDLIRDPLGQSAHRCILDISETPTTERISIGILLCILINSWAYLLKRSFQLIKKSSLKHSWSTTEMNASSQGMRMNWCTLQSISKIDHCCILWCAYVLFGIISVTPDRGIERNKQQDFRLVKRQCGLYRATALFFWLESYRPISNTPIQSCCEVHSSWRQFQTMQYSAALIEWICSFHHLISGQSHFSLAMSEYAKQHC